MRWFIWNVFFCSYYRSSPTFNECKLLGWECCSTSDDYTAVNDDGTINEDELEKIREYL